MVSADDTPPLCRRTPQYRCTADPATAMSWWTTPGFLRVVEPVRHTYVVFDLAGKHGARPPSADQGAHFVIVFHGRGGDPNRTPVGLLTESGALWIEGFLRDGPPAAAKPPGRRVEVLGQEGHVRLAEEGRRRTPIRLVSWTQAVEGGHVEWTATSRPDVYSEDETLRILNALEPS